MVVILRELRCDICFPVENIKITLLLSIIHKQYFSVFSQKYCYLQNKASSDNVAIFGSWWIHITIWKALGYANVTYFIVSHEFYRYKFPYSIHENGLNREKKKFKKIVPYLPFGNWVLSSCTRRKLNLRLFFMCSGLRKFIEREKKMCENVYVNKKKCMQQIIEI